MFVPRRGGGVNKQRALNIPPCQESEKLFLFLLNNISLTNDKHQANMSPSLASSPAEFVGLQVGCLRDISRTQSVINTPRVPDYHGPP